MCDRGRQGREREHSVGDRKPPGAGLGSALQLKDQAGRFVLAVPAERTESFSCPQRQQESGPKLALDQSPKSY